VKLAPPPPAPNLGGYVEVPSDDYLVTEQYEQYVSFQTPDGLTCRIEATAGCDGPLHGTPAPANEVALGGFIHTSKPQFTGPAGSPAKAPRLTARQLVCVVADRQRDRTAQRGSARQVPRPARLRHR
jgi:hypothetical protein